MICVPFAAVLPLLGEDTEVEIKRAVVRRIGRLTGQAAEDVLATIAERDAVAEVRVRAAKVLLGLGSQRAVGFLLAELSADEAFVRENAVRVLEKDERSRFAKQYVSCYRIQIQGFEPLPSRQW